MSIEATLPQVFRWTARLIGVAFVVFCLLHMIGEGFPPLVDFSPGEWGLGLGFTLCLVGFGLLWRWELLGGAVALAGITLFFALNFALSGKFPGGWVFPTLFLPGVLSLACWFTEHFKKTMQ